MQIVHACMLSCADWLDIFNAAKGGVDMPADPVAACNLCDRTASTKPVVCLLPVAMAAATDLLCNPASYVCFKYTHALKFEIYHSQSIALGI